MLVKDLGTAFRIVPGPPGRGLNKNFHRARIEHAKQAEAEQTAKSFDPRIGFAAAAAQRGANGEPYLVASGRTVHGLKDQIEREAQFQFADHQRDRRAAIYRHDVAAAHLALDLEAQAFEEALHRRIKARFQCSPSTRFASRRSSTNHGLCRDNTGS